MPDSPERRKAVAGAVARQIAHDFSNFVHNLILQFEIWDSAPHRPVDWRSLKPESRKMATLLQQWERYRGRAAFVEPQALDLHELIRQVADAEVQLAPSIQSSPLPMHGPVDEIRSFVALLIEEALRAREEAECDTPLLIDTERTERMAILRLQMAGDFPPLNPNDAERISLLEAACESLALRLDATIRRDVQGAGQRIVSAEFPLE